MAKRRGYTALLLKEEDKKRLQALFPPRFAKTHCHHITLEFNVLEQTVTEPAQVEVVGYASNEAVECLVVAIDGSIFRTDKKIYHITLSHEPQMTPAESNKLLAEQAFIEISPIKLSVKPVFIPFLINA